MPQMKAAEIPEPGAEFEIVEREIPDPDPDEVRIEVEACGVCHSDVFVKEGQWPGVDYPRTPGHEIAGYVDSVGDDVTEWAAGDRVGVGWHGGHCFTCEPCRRGDFIACENADVTGFDFDGGYAEYAVVPREALARMPEELDAESAAPLMCAGVTTFNALRNSSAEPGDLVAVQGIGGLGHLGVQFARASGFEVAAVSRGTGKRDLAFDLGADHFVDSESEDAGEALADLGGASVILATAPNADAVASITGGLDVEGELLTVAVPGDDVPVSIQPFITGRRRLQGWPSGTARDSQDTLEFGSLRDVESMVETYSLAEADEAYEAMLSGDARFRSVVEP